MFPYLCLIHLLRRYSVYTSFRCSSLDLAVAFYLAGGSVGETQDQFFRHIVNDYSVATKQ